MAKQPKQSQNKPNFIQTPKPNASIEKKYRLALSKKIKAMNKSLRWWLISSFKKNSPIAKLKKEFRYLSEYWELEFKHFAKKTANKMILSVLQFSDSILKDKGIFKNARKSALINQTLNARINENIALIKSIPKEQILRYESVLYNAISDFDKEKLTAELQKIKIEAVEKRLKNADKITENRIKTIARDQTKKATESLAQARAVSSGFEYYIWITANDERVSTGKGGHKYLDGRIYKYGENTAIIDSYGNVGTCGERVNCRCTSGAVYLMPNEELERVRDPEHGDYYRIIQKEINS